MQNAGAASDMATARLIYNQPAVLDDCEIVIILVISVSYMDIGVATAAFFP
jgi:hypothetical protein